MVWCGVVWCGVVWCGVVWCGVVWCGVVWCGVVWCGVVWCGVVWCGAHFCSWACLFAPSAPSSPSYNLVRILLVMMLAFLFGTVYWRMQYHKDDVFSRISFCYTTTFYVGLTFLLSGVTVLMAQRPVFYREQAANAYASWTYGVAFLLSELPYVTVNAVLFLFITWFFSWLYPVTSSPWTQFTTFWALFLPFWLFLLLCTVLGHAIAAISPTLEVGNAIGPGIASWFSSFAGFYLPPQFIPAPYLWVYWLNPFRYAFESMILAEFKDVPIACPAGGGGNSSSYCPFSNGNMVIEDMGLLGWGYWLDQLVLVLYTASFGIVALLGLRFLRYGSR